MKHRQRPPRPLKREGFKRVADQPDEVGVRWWYIAERDDGSFFARGGRTSSGHAARRELAGARAADMAERRLDSRFERPSYDFTRPDGDLRAVPR